MDMGDAIQQSIGALRMRGQKVDAGKWQGIPTEGKPDLMTKEILNLHIEAPMPVTMEDAQSIIRPNLPWAEDHFQERVGGKPMNPDPSHERWPWWRGQDDSTKVDGKFTHTYTERFWPKKAGKGEDPLCRRCGAGSMPGYHKNWGIRFAYGDLNDVVNQLFLEPMGRQAYLPIFFPEDTGAKHGGRVPCTLGYHFLRRGDRLHCWYDIRSCDAVRHFRDDIYLATRLVQWVVAELVEKELRSDKAQVWIDVDPGILFFCAHSFHVHMGDYHLLAS